MFKTEVVKERYLPLVTRGDNGIAILNPAGSDVGPMLICVMNESDDTLVVNSERIQVGNMGTLAPSLQQAVQN